MTANIGYLPVQVWAEWERRARTRNYIGYTCRLDSTFVPSDSYSSQSSYYCPYLTLPTAGVIKTIKDYTPKLSSEMMLFTSRKI